MKKITNYINKKNFLGFAIAVFMLIGAFTLSANTASADCSISTTLRVGSKGTEVQCLQTFVGATADGSFGPMTKAKVVAWQLSKGLFADGIFGPISRSVWINSAGNISYPAGCSSASGYSSTTGLPCSGGLNLPAGCLPGYLFSATTGIKCDVSTSNPDQLQGGAGDATFISNSTDVESEVREGDVNRKILGFRVTASDSDVAVKNITVSFQNSPAGLSSTRLTDYVKDVSIWMGGTKVGSANASDFSRNGIIYSKNIALTNATVREGSGNKQSFYVEVTALTNIDSEDLNNDNWKVTVGENSIRFMDATGVISTGGPSSEITTNPNFIDLATSGDVRVNITKGSNNPQVGNVEVSNISSTSDVKMLEFNVKAEGTTVTFNSMNLNLSATGTGKVEDIASEIAIYNGSKKLGDVISFNGNGIYKVNLYDDFTIDKGSTVTFKVLAKIKKIGTSTFAQGDSLTVSSANNLFAGSIEDTNGNTITNVTGSATGERQTFYSEGINVSDFTSTSTATTTQSGIFSKETYSISYKVTAFGNTYYIPKTVVRDSGSAAGLLYTVEKSSGITTAAIDGVVTSTDSSISSNASTVGGYFEIPDGETRTFNVTITLSNTGANMVTGFYRVHLDSVRYDTDQSGTPSSYVLTPVQNYNTQDRELDSI